MQSTAIQRQYDEIIAPHYDLDPQSMTNDTLDRAILQIRRHHAPASHDDDRLLDVLDVGAGTGFFLQKLRIEAELRLQPFALDISQKMIDIARERIPGLNVAVDDAANLDEHFQEETFDLLCTHFVTGFVPLDVLAPKIRAKLRPGGFWSFVGGTKAGFPTLQRKSRAKVLQWLFGGKTADVDELVHNPADEQEVRARLEAHGFVIRECETFEPKVTFSDFDEFMDFAYRGGWLTPFIVQLGLHKAGPVTRAALNTVLFPVQDHHSIVVALAQVADDR